MYGEIQKMKSLWIKLLQYLPADVTVVYKQYKIAKAKYLITKAQAELETIQFKRERGENA